MSDTPSVIPLDQTSVNSLLEKNNADNKEKSLLLINILQDRHVISHPYSYGDGKKVKISSDVKMALLRASGDLKSQMQILQVTIDAQKSEAKKEDVKKEVLEIVDIPDRKKIPTIIAGQKAEMKQIEDVKQAEKVAIKTRTQEGITQMKTSTGITSASFTHREKATSNINIDKASINDNDPKKSFSARIAFLSDLDGMSGVENNNKLFGRGDQKYIIGEKQLYNVLNRTVSDSTKLSQLLTRFNITEDWSENGMKKMQENFRDIVISQANEMASMTRLVLGDQHVGAGLVAVIEGNQKQFVDTLLSDPVGFQKIQSEVAGGTSLGMNILSMLLAVGVGVLTLGKLHASIEHRDIGSGHPLSVVLGSKVNFTAKLRAFEGVVQLNANDRETQIIKETLSFSDILIKAIGADKKIIIPSDLVLSKEQLSLVEFYNNNVSKLPSSSEKALIDELAYNYMTSLGKTEAGWSGKGVEAGFNLVSLQAYVGVTAQYVGSRVQEVGYNGATAAEGRSNAQSIALNELGITSEKTSDNKNWIYTLPQMDAIPEDMLALGATKDENGKIILISHEPLDFHQDTVYHINGDTETRITLNKKIKTAPVAPVAPQAVTIKNAQESREQVEGKITLGGSIYIMSRDKKTFKTFDRMLQLIGNRKYDEAYESLKEQAPNSTVVSAILSLIKPDLSNRDAILQAVNTYTYGGVGKNEESLDKKGYNRNRTKGVIRAEDRLAPASKNEAAEKFFASQPAHSPKHIRGLIGSESGQSLGVSVYATPLNGTHRIDKYDGSIQVDGHLYIDGKDGAKIGNVQKDRILSDHTSVIQKNLTEMNTYLQNIAGVNYSLSMDEYTQILKTGILPESLSNKGLMIKNKPYFFEARAFIHGNACVNKVEGIAFPTLGAPSVPPQVAISKEIVTEGFTAPIGQERMTVTEPGLGIGIGKLKINNNSSGNNNTTTTTTDLNPSSGNAGNAVGGGAVGGGGF